MPELLRSRLMTQPAETPKPDQDAALIAEARAYVATNGGQGPNSADILITTLADTLALRDRQIAGPIESRRLHERAASVNDADLHADLINALDLALDARDRQIAGLVEALRPFAGLDALDNITAEHFRAAARAVRSLETEEKT
jgi:hypothetical protein